MTVYADAASGDAAPLRTIAGAATQLLSAWFVAVDSVNGELYVADFIGQAVCVYPLHADGDVAPIRSLIHGANSGLDEPRAVVIDAVNDEIYVLSFNDSIRVFPRTASGDVAPARVIAGGNTLLDNPLGLVLDVVHDELITTSYNVGGAGVPGVLVFWNASTADGNVAPTRSIAGGNTQMGAFTNYV
ncbi:MAG: hypothetical protein PHQ14_06110, partial [Chromatiales bacterium]|nr:hypothetical protein [Chromatiales bacterium]